MIELINGIVAGTATSDGGGSAPVIDELNVTPSTSAQEITAPEGVDGFSPVKVSAVTASIDANIVAGNIKKDVTILSVTGTFEGGGKYKLFDRVTDDSNNEIGTVSGFFTDANNVEYAVVCLDAQYRITTDPYGNGQIASSYITYGTGSEYVSNAYGLKATATENTTAILGVAASSPAATHCRSKTFTIGGNTYSGQLPNLVEITDIMAQKTTLNSLDTSKSSYSSYVLPNNDNNVWSSSPAYSGYAWDVGVNQITSMTTNNSNFVVPVLELPNS